MLLDSEELERLDRAAERAGLARSTFIRQALLYQPAPQHETANGEDRPPDAGVAAGGATA